MLQRMVHSIELKFSNDNAKVGSFAGYASGLNLKDGGGDVVSPGAFKATLKEWKGRGKLPKMLLQHGMGLSTEDGIPVGKFTQMEEDSKGLPFEGYLFGLDTQKGKYIYEGMSSGELDGMSIGYQAIDVAYGKNADEPRRTLKKINLFETSIVTFPMNKEATVDSVKFDELFKSIGDAEDWLRDVVGLSHRQAKTFLSRIKGLSPSDSGGQDDLVKGIVEALPSIMR